MEDAHLDALAARLQGVGGVVAVVLGGSRARGTHRPDSDYDIGLYYRGGLDLAALGALAAAVGDAPVEVTAHGGWGPWMDGGGWLTVGGVRVDWIYRDVERVRRVWADCQQGRYEVATQAGYVHGFSSYIYAAEIATCRVLSDPSGEVTALQRAVRDYPRALGDALVRGLWQAGFALYGMRAGAAGEDPVFAAGHLFTAIAVMCQALHGRAGVWLVHEKGMVASAGRLAIVPDGFADEAYALLAAVGRTTAEITATADRAQALLARVEAACAP